MDRFQAMRLFTRIVELGSFTAAADDLQLPRATVTHAIKQLEARLKARLLERTTRSVRTTLDGEAYYQRCTRLLADLDETESVFRQTETSPRGVLRAALQGTVARHFILPALPDFFARYPDIRLELGFSDRPVDLVREGYDCAMRSGPLPDSSLVARQIILLEQATVASPDYLGRHGMPQEPEDLFRGHRAVSYMSMATGRHESLDFTIDGENRVFMLPNIVAVNDADAYVAACRAGLGIVQVPRYHIADDLKAGRLVEILAPWRLAPMPVSAVYPAHRQLSPRLRVFVDFLAELFRKAAVEGRL
jgi:LysR family transcriptional regulator, regulator for bpeEF and oprC